VKLMTLQDKQHEEKTLNIVEAVETLSSIADMNFDREIGVVQRHQLALDDEKLAYRTVHWLSEQDGMETIGMVRDVFRVVLDYLRNFYKDEYHAITDHHTMEGIKTIMVLVGEAAKKLDKYTKVFLKKDFKSVTTLKEYRDLQQFYQRRISKKVDEGQLGKWILGLSKKVKEAPQKEERMGRKPLKTKHVFVDLENVKKDNEYELFYIRKEDGSRYFSPRLIRNMKLVCDFGNYFVDNEGDDPLFSLPIWKDRSAHRSAASILRSIGGRLDRFFRETAKYRTHELPALISQALMALMLSSNPRNQMRNNPKKNCSEYFEDFQDFLSKAMRSREYERMVAYPPKQSNKLAHCLLDTVHSICRGMIIHMKGFYELSPAIEDLLREAKEERMISLKKREVPSSYCQQLEQDYAAMKQLMKRHPNGSLLKLLQSIENGDCNVFEPLRQGNHPSILFNFFINERGISNIRLPSPTSQEFIHKVHPIEEFYGFLRACLGDHILRSHLLINLQDRTSWREFYRCKAIEGMPHQGKFAKHLNCLTLACDTEFFHQLKPYHEDSDASVFIEHFLEHIRDESAGFMIPSLFNKHIFPDLAVDMMHAVHRIFFSNKKKLLRDERLDFILIYYYFLVLKFIDIAAPDSFSFTCKDGVDVSGSMNLLFAGVNKLMNHDSFSSGDQEVINYLLYAPAITVRERLMIDERFKRTLSALNHVEELREEFGRENFLLIVREAFEDFFSQPILTAEIIPPKD